MKKIITFLLALALLSCTADKVLYRESTNYNYLDFGSYQIGIDKIFQFVGVLEHKGKTQDMMLSSRKLPYKWELYVFADASQGKENVKRAIAVNVYTLRGSAYFRGEANFDGYKSTEHIRVLHKGMSDINGIKTACVVHTIASLNAKVLKIAAEKGFKPSSDLKQGIDVKFGKLIGRSRKIHIEYVESCDDDQPNAFVYIKRAKQVFTFEKR